MRINSKETGITTAEIIAHVGIDLEEKSQLISKSRIGIPENNFNALVLQIIA